MDSNKIKNTKNISITLPIDLLEVIRILKTEPGGRFQGRKTSNICALLVCDALSQIKKEDLTRLLGD